MLPVPCSYQKLRLEYAIRPRSIIELASERGRRGYGGISSPAKGRPIPGQVRIWQENVHTYPFSPTFISPVLSDPNGIPARVYFHTSSSLISNAFFTISITKGCGDVANIYPRLV